MKKMMMIAAFAAIAAISQAISVGWNVTNLAFDNKVDPSAGVAFFFVVGENGVTGLDQITAIAAKGGDLSSYAYGKSSAVDMSASNGKAGYTYAQSGLDMTANTTFTVFSVIYDNASKPANYIATSEVSLALRTANKNQAFGSAANLGGWTPVPEPCSVALIALGLAAFGLKRKVA